MEPEFLPIIVEIIFFIKEKLSGMKDLLNLFRWQDGLDILILAYIFYRFYLRLRKKKALRMVLGILALPLFYLFAQWIDLPLSVWGIQNLWPVIIILRRKGDVVQKYQFLLLDSSFFIAIAMAEVPTPTFRAISAMEIPISLLK